MSTRVDVAIIGGGLAGLSVADRLRTLRPDLTCHVYEASDRAGGKLQTEHIHLDDGQFIVEAGPDAFLAQKPWARELIAELGLSDQIIPINRPPHPVAILKRGRFVDLPAGVTLLAPTKLRPFLRSHLLSPMAKLRVAADLVLPAKSTHADESLAAFVTRRLGRDALDWIAEPIAAGIYNADPNEMSLQATFPQFRDLERQHRSLIRGLRAKKPVAPAPRGRLVTPESGAMTNSPLPRFFLRGRSFPPTERGEARWGDWAGAEGYLPSETLKAGTEPRHYGHMRTPPFLTLRNGMQTLADTLAQRLAETVDLNAPITSLDRLPTGGYQLTFADRPPVLAGSVVVTTPAATAATLLRDIAPRASEHLATLRAAHAGTISLAYCTSDIPRLPTGYGIVIPKREDRPINAVTITSRKFDHRAPDGWTLLRVFFGGYRSPATMHLADPALLDLVTRELEHLFGVTAPPAFHRIQRWSAGSPQYDLGHLDRIAAIEHVLPDTIRVTGSAYRGVGIPDVIHQAWNTADHLAATLTQRSAPAVPAID